MASERLRNRLELRRSNAAVPHRNRYREAKSGQDAWRAEAEADLSSTTTTATQTPPTGSTDFRPTYQTVS